MERIEEMKITLCSKNQSTVHGAKEYLAWLWDGPRGASCIGTAGKTRYGKWQYHGRTADRYGVEIDFDSLKELRAYLKQSWGIA